VLAAAVRSGAWFRQYKARRFFVTPGLYRQDF
jgi:hypothetical protein